MHHIFAVLLAGLARTNLALALCTEANARNCRLLPPFLLNRSIYSWQSAVFCVCFCPQSGPRAISFALFFSYFSVLGRPHPTPDMSHRLTPPMENAPCRSSVSQSRSVECRTSVRILHVVLCARLLQDLSRGASRGRFVVAIATQYFRGGVDSC